MNRTCAYCGAPRETKDHIPPSGIFPDSISKLNLITVPSCKPCNNSADKDDKLFRAMMVTMAADSPHSRLVWDGPIRRSVEKGDRQLLQALHDRMELIEHRTPSGIYTGKATAIRFNDDQWEAFWRTAHRVGKGLYWKIFQHPIPSTHEAKSRFIYSDQMGNIVSIMQQIVIPEHTGDTFAYAYSAAESESALILTSYYDKITIATFVAPHGVLVDSKNKKTTTLDLR